MLAFPCNQFGSQEPGSESEIKEFVESKYGVTFPMFSKIDVNGPGAHPIYQYLTSNEEVGTEEIGWNFYKFLVDKEGRVVKRYIHRVTPLDLEQDIVDLLG